MDGMLQQLRAMQREVCAYDWGSLTPPSTCDCKFYDPLRMSGEATGCPELRQAIEAIQAAR